MKKGFLSSALITVGAAALLTACSGGDPPDPTVTQILLQTEPVTQAPSPTEGAQGWYQDTPTHRAFREALRMVHDELSWPELEDLGRIELWDGDKAIEAEQFAVCDVDGDGEEELLISVTNTYMAGMCQVVYGYDGETDVLRAETITFPAVTYYPGMYRVEASHNHGYAGDVLWPYAVWVYDAEEDLYELSCSVDAWDREITDYDPYREMPFPEDLDPQGTGVVYILTENGQERFLSQSDYQAWEETLFSQLEPLEIPWQPMTEQNIAME